MEDGLFEWSDEAWPATVGEGTLRLDMPLAARLRPRSLSEYIGQERVRENLRVLEKALGK